jgi:cardiolipin synthase
MPSPDVDMRSGPMPPSPILLPRGRVSLPEARPAEAGLARAAARVSGAPLRHGNAVVLLRDGDENYEAWLDAITRARRQVHFENFIVADDRVGRRFAEALAAKASEGIDVRVVYDWLGCVGRSGASFWSALRRAGVEARAFNPPRLSAPLCFQRNHRKLITVDGEVGFVSGLCLADHWCGDRDGCPDPWRDTGVALRGPAVSDLDAAFAESWSLAGARLPPGALVPAEAQPVAGANAVRVVAGRPYQLATYRLDQLVAAGAERRLWLTDAYFVATAAYVQALTEAARDGVDVRLLVPGACDVPMLSNVVRAGYRPLIEAGVRVYEWNGSMLHAKTAVADGRWSRVGSTNLNLTSWVTNWELDVTVEDEGFAAEMEAMFLEDLARSTEVVPTIRRRGSAAKGRKRPRMSHLAGSAAGLKRMAGAAFSGTRFLTVAESRSIVRLGLALVALAALVMAWPALVTVPLGLALGWLGLALLLRAWRMRRTVRTLERLRRAGLPPARG